MTRVDALTAAALLLDLDGTLIDSTKAVERSWLTWAAEHGVDPEVLVHAHGRPSAETVAQALAGAADPAAMAAAVARIEDLEVTDTDGVVLLPGAVELLASLPAGRWAVVTSCSDALAAARIRAAGVPEVPVLVTAGHITRGKPDPEPYLLGAQLLGVPPERCVVVEDAPSGIASARAAGMGVVAVTTTYPPDALQADLVVGVPGDLAVEVLPDGLRIGVRPGGAAVPVDGAADGAGGVARGGAVGGAG